MTEEEIFKINRKLQKMIDKSEVVGDERFASSTRSSIRPDVFRMKAWHVIYSFVYKNHASH